MNIELSALAGLILSLGLEYIPGLAGLYGKLDPTQKRLTMLVLILVSAGALYGLSCAEIVDYAECSTRGILDLLGMVGVAIGVNQGTHLLTKKS